MIKEELGVRRVCQSCQTRFYDLQRKPILCPKCQAPCDPSVLYKAKRGRAAVKEAVPLPVFDSLEEIELVTDVVEEGDVLIEDPDDLGHEEDVVGVLDHHDDKESG